MYLARFAGDGDNFVTAAFRWPASSGAILPAAWRRRLLDDPAFDVSLRLSAAQGKPQVLLQLTADAAAASELNACCDQLLATGAPAELATPSDAKQYDEVVGMPAPWQLRVNYDGYQHGGQPLACDFRLYPMVVAQLVESGAAYQVHLRPFKPNNETQRAARKYLAQLEIAKLFTPPVRTLQEILVRRLSARGWCASELLALPDEPARTHWTSRIERHFAETTGQIGFTEPPLEAGDFGDWLFTGRHPSRAAAPPSLPCEAASTFTHDEVGLLASMRFAAAADGQRPPGADQPPSVFISYASADFAHAAAVCARLEEQGVPCWIAPRDINRDVLPYPQAIEQAINQVRAVVVLVSDTANLSVHIPRELDLALAQKLLIVPVQLENVAPAGQLRYLLATCQWLNAYDQDFHASVDELLARLRRII
jgi:hypothetical protein